MARNHLFNPTTEDSLYFGTKIFENIEEKYVITINNEKIPFQDTITIKKQDTLEAQTLFLNFDLLINYTIDSLIQKETLVLNKDRYKRKK